MINQEQTLRLKCSFCFKRLATKIYTDGETLQEINICDECSKLIYGGDDEI
jgi:hypothetical protein